jgi:glycosyltransferase involved in cell wall biosynthesis
MAMDLSLIIPCYNEGTHIERSLPEVALVLSTTNLDYEIIVIDDCSRDDTREKLQRLAALDPRICLRPNDHNLGRGGTVTRGIRESSAKVVGFLDIDLSTHPIYAPYLSRMILDDKTDVATCRRTYKIELRVLHRTWFRMVLSHGYRRFSNLMFQHGLKDTETGFKFFNRVKILPILDQICDHHWFWDTEVMVLSQRAGLRVTEVDSLYVRRPEKPSTVKIVRDVLGYLKSAFHFRKRLKQRSKIQVCQHIHE